MNTEVIKSVVMVSVMFLMLGVGLSLTVADFRRVARHPTVVIVATLGQLILLPLIALLLTVAASEAAAREFPDLDVTIRGNRSQERGSRIE